MPTPKDDFLERLAAAVNDAALGYKVSQLRVTCDPDGTGPRMVRIIVVPEEIIDLEG